MSINKLHLHAIKLRNLVTIVNILLKCIKYALTEMAQHHTRYHEIFLIMLVRALKVNSVCTPCGNKAAKYNISRQYVVAYLDHGVHSIPWVRVLWESLQVSHFHSSQREMVINLSCVGDKTGPELADYFLIKV